MRTNLFILLFTLSPLVYGQDILIDPTLKQREKERIGRIYGADMPTTADFKFSKNVKSVKEIDSSGNIISYKFNKDGYLIEENHTGKRYSIERKWNYQEKRLISTIDKFNNKYESTASAVQYYYQGNRLEEVKIFSIDTEGIEYNRHEDYVYSNDSLKKIVRITNDRIETEEFLYNNISGPRRTKHTKTDELEILEEEFKIKDTIWLYRYHTQSDSTTAYKSYYIYNNHNKVLEYVDYYPLGIFQSEKYTYQNDKLYSFNIFYADGGTKEYFLNSYEDVEKVVDYAGTMAYKYEYNKFGDIIENRMFFNGELKNIKRYEIQYWD
jgi:hypothetical protein